MDNNQQIKEMISKMKAAMTVDIEERVVTKMKEDMEEMTEKMNKDMRKEIEQKVKVMRDKMKEVKKQLTTLMTKNVELTSRLKEVDQKSPRESPYVMACAYLYHWINANATIHYDHLSLQYLNHQYAGG